MRIYNNFKEAIPEIYRDLVEMGIKVFPQTYQDKIVKGNPDFETLELQNYIYTVVHPCGDDLMPDRPWANVEWVEREIGILGHPVNPGKAWTYRDKVWSQFLVGDPPCFSYTYGERLALSNQVIKVIERLREDPESRQLYIGIWRQSDNEVLGGISRVPCSLGYQLQCRKERLNITYLQRSCDIVTHFVNDAYLAFVLQKFIAHNVNIALGTFTHWIGSLHMFKKDAAGIF